MVLNIDSKYWGKHFWYMLYSIAATYPYSPDNEFKAHVKMLMISLKSLLPCQSCKQSYCTYSSESDTNILAMHNYSNKDNFTKLIYNLRNKINRKIDAEYGITYEYFCKKLELMVSTENNTLNAHINNLKEAQLINSLYKPLIYNYVKKNKKMIPDYSETFTDRLINKIESFYAKPVFNIKNKLFQLVYKRHNECNQIIETIHLNMSLHNYTYKESFIKDKKYWVKLFYNGCCPLNAKQMSDLV
jgi:hypothetical protein